MRELDRIHIRDLAVMGIIGVNPEERVSRQEVLVNVTLWADTRPAAVSDDIADAVNYRTVSKALIARIEGSQPMLVERLASDLAAVCLDTDERIAEVEVTVEKPGALRHSRSVGITIHRSRVPSESED